MSYSFVPRSMLTQVFQLGQETSPGVGGSATNRLTTLNSQIAPVASGAFPIFRPSGGKYVGQIVPGDLYSEGPISDTVDFNTLPFIAASNIGYDGPPVANGAAGWDWTFTPTPFAASTGITYVAAEGVPTVGAILGAVYNFRNVIFPDFGMRFLRTGAATTTGRVLGRKMEPGSAMAAPTQFQGRAVPTINVGMWHAADWTTLVAGGTRFSPPILDFTFRHNSVFAPWFALDDSISSFYGTLDGAVDAGIQIQVPADVDTFLTPDDIAGQLSLGKMSEGERIFLKLMALGPYLVGTSGARYSIELFMCAQISAPPRRSAVGNIRTWQWDALLVPDDSAGGSGLPMQLAVTCKVADLT
jgi:hypothetical protein